MPVGAMSAARRRIPAVIPRGQIPAGLRNANSCPDVLDTSRRVLDY
jgi:hypothetical protein